MASADAARSTGNGLMDALRDNLWGSRAQELISQGHSWAHTVLGWPSALFWFGMGSGMALACMKAKLQRTRDRVQTKLEQDRENASVEKDRKAAFDASGRLYQIFGGLLTSSAIYVGDQLGLYEELRKSGPMTTKALACKTGLHERWLHEWLLQQAAAKILNYDPKTCAFSLPYGLDIALTDPNIVSMFQMGPGLASRIASLMHVMQDPDGLGEPYDGSFKEDFATAIERRHVNAYKIGLPDHVFRSAYLMNGELSTLLAKGGMRVAEVGCGTATGLIELARRFPKSDFHGFELSEEAIAQAQTHIARSHLSNVHMHDVRESPMEANSFDFVYCHDVVHDCAQPMALLRDVFRGLRAGCSFLAIDIKTHENDEGILADPSAPVALGFSCGLCLHSGSSEKSGARLGTMGLRPSLFNEMLTEVGFTSFQAFSVDILPGNACYVVRKP